MTVQNIHIRQRSFHLAQVEIRLSGRFRRVIEVVRLTSKQVSQMTLFERDKRIRIVRMSLRTKVCGSDVVVSDDEGAAAA